MDVERSQQNMMTNGRGQDGIFLTLTQRQETIDYLKYILKYREGKVNGSDNAEKATARGAFKRTRESDAVAETK
ncbi:hypothetical protein Pmar_PMAR018003 [Perkinsus marinus ATCC 50983]|uniref:Uncharacterized protein n=1 Tax=Perkinsus marinus (strain ATCC 50983 / TXsc) TaxID=423536 RepID=C5LND3_PERM5|nr:hypothetical protein Pmar_PMAR018003 [Perkinsus marinus ATCC 50983]EER01773.1 hypothetical protein Pmar_PMAR018003 [Perkinsus marinus ATCC 50983]|eukprot:XP_002769055.1 hypothetical protein Pmar_PMAR018003 [Perkinsus marinus ATCC 50983]